MRVRDVLLRISQEERTALIMALDLATVELTPRPLDKPKFLVVARQLRAADQDKLVHRLGEIRGYLVAL